MSNKQIRLEPHQVAPALRISVLRQSCILSDVKKECEKTGENMNIMFALEYGTACGLLTALTLVDPDAGAMLADQLGLMSTVTSVMLDLSRDDIAQRASRVSKGLSKGQEGLYV